MSESREVEFQSLVRQIAGELLAFTDVKEKNNSMYFTVAGHQFRTFGDRIHHSGSIFFDHSYTDFLARREGTPEGIEEEQKISVEINEELDDWGKYGDQVLEIAIVQAVTILKDRGRDEFVKFLKDHFFITTENEGKRLLKFVKENA